MQTLNRFNQNTKGKKIRIKYSTPTEYFKAVEQELDLHELKLNTYETDFSHYDEKV